MWTCLRSYFHIPRKKGNVVLLDLILFAVMNRYFGLLPKSFVYEVFVGTWDISIVQHLPANLCFIRLYVYYIPTLPSWSFEPKTVEPLNQVAITSLFTLFCCCISHAMLSPTPRILRSCYTLSCHLSLGLPGGLLPSCFPWLIFCISFPSDLTISMVSMYYIHIVNTYMLYVYLLSFSHALLLLFSCMLM